MTLLKSNIPPTIVEQAASTSRLPAAPIPQLASDALESLRRFFTESGYLAALDLNLSSEQKAQQELNPRLALLSSLFSRGEALTTADAVEAVSPLDFNALIAAGLLQMDQQRVIALFQIQVYRGLLFIVDS